MIRNLKTLGVALMAVLALGAVVASAASAQGKLTSDGAVTLNGVETVGAPATENRLTAFGAFVQCPGSTYTGHKYNVTPHTFIPSGETTFTLTPHYKQTKTATEPNCEGPFGWRATVHMNGCDYVAHIGAEVSANTYAVTFDVICPAGNEITVTLWTSEADHTSKPNSPFCILHVKEQKGLSGAHATDLKTGSGQLKGTVTGITVKRTQGDEVSAFCPTSEEAAGKFDLNVTISGVDSTGKATAISLSK